ncbi:MAG: hypothetical protein U1F21_05540 [Sphaerotilus natans]
MIDDRIGTIGSTQGVKDSSTPASAKAAATLSRLPEPSTEAKRSPIAPPTPPRPCDRSVPGKSSSGASSAPAPARRRRSRCAGRTAVLQLR